MPDLYTPQPTEKKISEVTDQTRNIRLLVCGQCKTIEELPDYEGPADRDVVLSAAVSKHRSAGMAHAPAQLLKVEEVAWSNPTIRDQIVQQISQLWKGDGQTGFGAETYATMDNFRADAMKCWVRDHNRTKDCGDYKSDSKRLVPGTREGRKELGLDPNYDAGGPHLTRYLCEWCPYESIVQQKRVKKVGLDA